MFSVKFQECHKRAHCYHSRLAIIVVMTYLFDFRILQPKRFLGLSCRYSCQIKMSFVKPKTLDFDRKIPTTKTTLL